MPGYGESSKPDEAFSKTQFIVDLMEKLDAGNQEEFSIGNNKITVGNCCGVPSGVLIVQTNNNMTKSHPPTELPVLVSPSMSGGYAVGVALDTPHLLSGWVPVAPVSITRYNLIVVAEQ